MKHFMDSNTTYVPPVSLPEDSGDDFDTVLYLAITVSAVVLGVLIVACLRDCYKQWRSRRQREATPFGPDQSQQYQQPTGAACNEESPLLYQEIKHDDTLQHMAATSSSIYEGHSSHPQPNTIPSEKTEKPNFISGDDRIKTTLQTSNLYSNA